MSRAEFFFVYGTLKKGYHNHYCLGDAKLRGEAVSLNDKLCMTEGGFPFVSDSYCGSRVKGELYVVDSEDTVRRLDQLEGNGRFYTRVKEDFKLYKNDLYNNDNYSAWVYKVPFELAVKYSPSKIDSEGVYYWG